MSITAAPEVQVRLLEVQALDTRLAQNAHRRRSLPERAELAAVQQQAAVLRDRLIAAETEVSDLERDQAKAEADVESVRQRARRDQERLDSGSASPKELEGLQHEIQSLARRQSDLEDVELEVMQRLEDARGAMAVLQGERAVLEERQGALEATIAAAEVELDAEGAGLADERARLQATVDEPLLALYERIRADHDGVGAAAVHRGQCMGCRIALDQMEISRIRDAAPETVLRCEQCRRILVRTAESGL